MAILIEPPQPPQNELSALQNLSDNAGFLKKTGDGNYSIDSNSYLTANQTITVSGDATGSGTTNISLTLAASGVTAGTYNNSATQVRPFAVDAKGRITSVGAAVTITPAWASINSKPTTLSGYGITDAQPLSNELTAIHSLADTAGFLKKTGNGAYSIDVNSYLNLTGGSLTGTLNTNSSIVSTAAVASISTTTGAIVAASLGISGAIFAETLNGNGSGITNIKADNISSGTMPYQRINMTENTPPVNDSSPAVNTICNMGVSLNNGYPLTGHLFSSVASSIRGIQILSNPLAPESSYIRSCHTNFPTGWSPWQKIAIENLSGRVQSTSGFSVGSNQVVSARRTGWVAPTGTASRTAFSTATVTLPQLAERVKALIDDLTAHGLIGA